jgi:hypothetical protein
MFMIYFGLPGKMCNEGDCLWGPALWAAQIYFNGMMIPYDGTLKGYFHALWHFIKGDLNDVDGN